MKPCRSEEDSEDRRQRAHLLLCRQTSVPPSSVSKKINKRPMRRSLRQKLQIASTRLSKAKRQPRTADSENPTEPQSATNPGRSSPIARANKLTTDSQSRVSKRQ